MDKYSPVKAVALMDFNVVNLAVADAFDALTSKRPCKEARRGEDTMNFMKSQQDKHFEPKLITVLEQNLDKFLEIKQHRQETD